MATKAHLPISEIGLATPKLFTRIRTTIESAFYQNNVIPVLTVNQAYDLAKNAPGTIITSQKVERAEELGLPSDAKVLLFNDGNITGRQARLRRLVNKENEDQFASLLRDVEFATHRKKLYHAQVYVGLDKEFMVKAHLLIPEGYENLLYNWVLNFQIVDEKTTRMYNDSVLLDEGDIYILSDPDQYPPQFPEGLALFEEKSNCACLLGMKYFGEHKKGTLTLAWSIAQRNGYTACHGGQKQFHLGKDKDKVIGVFGLSGSGKSTITLSDHNQKFDITVLHDDAFIISNKDASSISLEPSYFDKTQDYPLTNPQSKYFLTIQNCGVTTDQNNNIVPVTQDIRNGNGRTVKSKFATPKRAYRFEKSCDAIFWIMKDSSLPPVIKIKSPALASVMGATLATKRTTAEYIKGEDPNKLVIVPYANPFRLYPLAQDYYKFKDLFQNRKVECYIINTGFFLNKKITPQVTLGLIEDIITMNTEFIPFGPYSELEYAPINGFDVDFDNCEYGKMVKDRMMDRLEFIQNNDEIDKLPEEAIQALKNTIQQAK